MPSDFENQLSRLLHQDADAVTPLISKESLLAGLQSRYVTGDGRRGQRTRLPLVAVICAALVVALLAVLFQSGALRQHDGANSSCPPNTLPAIAYTTPPSRVTYQGVTLQVTQGYVGFDFIEVAYTLTGPNQTLQSFVLSRINHGSGPYVRDTAGHYSVDDRGGAGGWVVRGNSASGRGVFAPFTAQPATQDQTFVLGFPVLNAQPLEVSFQAPVVSGKHIQVDPAFTRVNGIGVQVDDALISQSSNPLTNGLQSLRLHIHISGLPEAATCDNRVNEVFQEGKGLGDPQPVPPNQGWDGPGDQATLTFPDGTSLHPTLAQMGGAIAFLGDDPQPTVVLLPPAAHGQLDMYVVFYAPQFPTTGTIAFSLDQLRPYYEWGSLTSPHGKGYHFQGPWNLTIPLSS